MALRISQGFTAVAGIAALLGSLFILPFGAQTRSQAQNTPAEPVQRMISVSGSGSVTAQPDIAVVVLGVQSDEVTAREALAANSSQMEGLMAALREAGVAAADIRTRSVQLYPRYKDDQTTGTGETTESRIAGYTAINSVEVTVRDVAKLGELLDSAVEAGSNQIESIRFDVSSPGELVDQAREAAFKDAQKKAGQLAGLAGGVLGKAITINESSYFPMAVQQEALMMDRAAAPVPVSPGTQTLTVDVQVTFELVYETATP